VASQLHCLLVIQSTDSDVVSIGGRYWGTKEEEAARPSPRPVALVVVVPRYGLVPNGRAVDKRKREQGDSSRIVSFEGGRSRSSLRANEQKPFFDRRLLSKGGSIKSGMSIRYTTRDGISSLRERYCYSIESTRSAQRPAPGVP
jgi:hypothetical protein